MIFKEFIDYRLTQRNFIHDFSLGALLTYHKIEKLLEKNKCRLEKEFVLFESKSSINLFLYEEFKELEQVIEETSLNKKVRIYSQKPLERFKIKYKKQEEVFYQISKLKQNYHSYNKPINIFEDRPDLEIELRDIAGQAGLKELHDEWVKYKLSLPKTYKISFPTARYRNTLNELQIPTYRKAIYIKNKLYGFIVFSLEDEVAFELSFCTFYWKPEFKILNGLNQYIFTYCVIQLQKKGIKFVNSGYILNKNLKIFKQCVLEADSIHKYVYQI